MTILPWIYAARPKTLVASIVPILCATLILPNQVIFKLDIFIFTLIAAIIIQIVTNYINDLYDFLKGTDKDRLGPKRILQSGKLSQSEIQRAILLLIILGILCGIPLVIKGGWPIIIIGLSDNFILLLKPFALPPMTKSNLILFCLRTCIIIDVIVVFP